MRFIQQVWYCMAWFHISCALWPFKAIVHAKPTNIMCYGIPWAYMDAIHLFLIVNEMNFLSVFNSFLNKFNIMLTIL